jgi:hypothetical protein
MALDTKTKRGAAAQVGQAPGVVLPNPDGTIDAADRAELAGLAMPSGVPGSDSTPDAFAFAPATGLALSTLTTSGGAVISGIDTAANISVVGGEYSIDLGAWVSAPGTINNGSSVRVRGTSSASYATQTTVTLTIGGVSANFILQTQGQSVGGDYVPPPRKKKPPRKKLTLNRDRNLTEDIRGIYRELTQAPATRERAQEIAARSAPAPKGATVVPLRTLTPEDEIALRMMHKELTDQIDAQDEEVIGQLLARLL